MKNNPDVIVNQNGCLFRNGTTGDSLLIADHIRFVNSSSIFDFNSLVGSGLNPAEILEKKLATAYYGTWMGNPQELNMPTLSSM